MSVLHDVRCRDCEKVESDVWVSDQDYGTCPGCRSKNRTWLPVSFATDVYGAPQYSDATGLARDDHDRRTVLTDLHE